MSKPLRPKRRSRGNRQLSLAPDLDRPEATADMPIEMQAEVERLAKMSRAIKNRIMQQHRVSQLVTQREPTIPERLCLFCGKPKRHNNSYCSAECAKSQREQPRR